MQTLEIARRVYVFTLDPETGAHARERVITREMAEDWIRLGTVKPLGDGVVRNVLLVDQLAGHKRGPATPLTAHSYCKQRGVLKEPVKNGFGEVIGKVYQPRRMSRFEAMISLVPLNSVFREA